MGDVPASEMEWNESFFRDCFDNVSKMVTWIVRKQKPFASQVSMTERVMQQKKVFKTLAKDELFLEWLGKLPKVIRLEVQTLVCMTLLFFYFKYSYFPVYFLIVIFLCVRNIYYIIYYIIYV
jgi:hypothetical protein